MAGGSRELQSFWEGQGAARIFEIENLKLLFLYIDFPKQANTLEIDEHNSHNNKV